MWKAILKIKDKVRKINKIIEYKFYKVTTYLQLFRDLKLIYPKYNKENEITFTFNYLGKSVLIDDFNKYILNNDEIEIEIKKCKPLYYLYDPEFNSEIVESYDLKKLQEYSRVYLDGEILLYKRIGYLDKFVDVLTKPEFYKNQCINRLVKKYNY
jgi:hypothetical protein